MSEMDEVYEFLKEFKSQGERLSEIVRKELQAAKADNGRLQDGFVKAVVHFDNGMGALAKMEWVKALSTSNSLDWLKGEIWEAYNRGLKDGMTGRLNPQSKGEKPTTKGGK